MFRLDPGGDETDDDRDEQPQPEWFGPPEGELGECVPLSVVVGRSEKTVVALQHVTAFSTGVTLDLVAAARGLRRSETNRLFHEQHVADYDEGLPDGFLRLGIELADGSRASNVADRRALWRHDAEPRGPVLVQRGGGGGSAGSGRVTMNPAYWLWPLPPAGPLRLFVEWPALGIPLSSAELDSSAVLAAAARSQPLWPS